MKKYTIKHLKESLSEITQLAAQGELILIGPYDCFQGVVVGKKSHTHHLQPLSNRALTQGQFLSFLDEDRS